MEEEPFSLSVNILSNKWDNIKHKINILFKTSIKHIEKFTKKNISGELSVCLTNDKHIQNLNNIYRKKNKPTNVLAFESVDKLTLGDIILSFDTINKEAEIQKKIFYDHVLHLFIHGMLHLLGYDHKEEKDEKFMEELEIKILKKMGVENPYV